MKKQSKNLLPKIDSKRDALNWSLFNIKPRFPRWFKWLAIISLALTFTLSGYYPTIGIPPVKKARVLAANLEQTGEIVANSFSNPIVLPHPGYLSTRFSSYHPGVDIATGLGMPIHPITDGEISLVARDFFGLGNYVEVLHENGFRSKYAHMGRVFVRVGDKVTSENTLGEVGLTGRTTGPHTHLEITKEGNYVNPLTLLPEIPNMPAPVLAKR